MRHRFAFPLASNDYDGTPPPDYDFEDPFKFLSVERVLSYLDDFTRGSDRFYSLSMAVYVTGNNYSGQVIPDHLRRRLLVAVDRAWTAAPRLMPDVAPQVIENGFRALFILAELWGAQKEPTKDGKRLRLPKNPLDPRGEYRHTILSWARILQNCVTR